EPSRLQGAYLSSEETERLMSWYQTRREAEQARREAGGLAVFASEDETDILETVRAREAAEAGRAKGEDEDSADGERDRLFREAAEVCIQHQGGSTSLLQRRLKIGYGRAARIIDQLHLAGILGPPAGSKPRDVLVGLEDLARIAGERAASRGRECGPVASITCDRPASIFHDTFRLRPVSAVRIAFLSLADARDLRSWSGTLAFSKAALARHVGEVVDLSPAPIPTLPLKALDA